MKKLLLRSLYLLPLMLIVMAVNVWIDPVHLLSNNYYEKAGLLLEKNSIEYGDCDDRKLMIEFLKHKKDTEMLVLGSSRTAIIDSSYVGAPLLNLSLSSAVTEDMIAAYGLYISNHRQPKKVLIGIDPYSLNKIRSRHSAKGFLLAPYYNAMLKNMGLPQLPEAETESIMDNKYMNIISFRYFQNSLLSIGKKGFGRREPVIRYNNSEVGIKDMNGVLRYRSGWQSDPKEVDISVARDISNDVLLGINGFNEISAERVELLQHFLHYMSEQHVQVIVFLAPYHPTMWNYISAQEKYSSIINASEKTIRKLGEDQHMDVIGTFNPAKYNLSSVDFYDAVHLKPAGLSKVFAREWIN